MIASVLVGKLCVIAAVAAVALVLEVVVPILRLKLLARRLAEDEKVGKVEGVDEVEKVDEVEGVERVEVLVSKFQVLGDGFQVGGVEAEKMWAEACGMIHSETPDFSTDWQYMTLVHKAAELGHAGAMSALGDFAFQRGDVVEAFYWKQRGEMGGGRCRNPTLTDIVRVWSEVGCPDGVEEVGVRFPVQRADFAHAVLCLKSGVDPRFGAMRLKELSDAGDEDAMRFLKRR